MAEIVGLAAAILSLVKATKAVCNGVRELHGLLGELPGRLATLSNEIADLEIVLVQLSACLKEREGISLSGYATGTDVHQQVATAIASLSDQLGEVTTIVGRIKSSGSTGLRSKVGPVFAWKKHHTRLNDVQDQIVKNKAKLHLILDAATISDFNHVHVQLSGLSLQTNTLAQLNSVEHGELQVLIRQQTQLLMQHIDHQLALSVASMQRNAATLPPLGPNIASPPSGPTQVEQKKRGQVSPGWPEGQVDAVRVGVRSNAAWCPRGCPCSCHAIHRSSTPGVLSRVLGQLFVNYIGLPGVSAGCDSAACKQNETPQVNAEYWFPIGFFWSKIISVQASYQASVGPSLQLRTLRRVPDSHPAVNYAMNGNVDGMRMLFVKGLASPVDVSDTRGYTLLRWAVYSQQWDMVRFLDSQGADVDYRPKAKSDNSPRNKASDLLFQGGLSEGGVKALTLLSHRDEWIEEQNFPLVTKIVLGLSGKDLLQALEERPQAVHDRDAMRRTALSWAAARGDEDAVTMLLAFNADPNVMDIQNAGPVSNAANQGHTVCVRILLAAGGHPDPELPEKKGSPLNCAARNASDPLLIKTLLEFGAHVDACGVDGQTSLIHAARRDNIGFAQILLEYNANINAISTAGQTPLTTAIVHNSHGVLRLLLERWAQYSACPRLTGPHLLKLTAQYADLETMSILASTKHFRLKRDKLYGTGDFETLLQDRPDADKKLVQAFADLLAMFRGEAGNPRIDPYGGWPSSQAALGRSEKTAVGEEEARHSELLRSPLEPQRKVVKEGTDDAMIPR